MNRVVKVVSMVLLFSTLFLFAFPVFATSGMGASTWKTGTNSIDSVNVVVDVIEARAEQISGSGSSIVWEKDFLVTVQVYNTQSTPVFINNLGFNLQFPSGSQVGVVSLDNFGTDLFISTDGNYMFSLVPSNDFAFGSGVVVPPNSSLWAVGTVRAQKVSDSNSNFNLSSVIVRTFTTARGSAYTFGSPVDWSPLITSLDGYFSQEHLDNNNILTLLGTIKVDSAAAVTALNNIISDIAYSGSYFNFAPSSAISVSASNIINENGVTSSVNRRVGRSFLIESSVTTDSVADTQVVDYTYRIPFIVSIALNNSNTSDVRSSYLFTIEGLFPSVSQYSLVIDYFYSDIFDSFGISTNPAFRFRNRDYSYGYVGSRSRNYTTIIGHIDLPSEVSLSWPDVISSSNTFTSGFNYYAPRDEFTILRDIYIAYQGNSNVSDQVSTSATSTSSQLSGIHAQEEALYSQNEQALSNSGISNFHFDSSTSSAINLPRNLFERLWLSLGPYTVVYTFSMLLTLGLVIIRYTNGRKKGHSDG